MLFSNQPGTDRVLAMLLTLSGEVWALRERLAAWEAVAEQRGLGGELDVNGYQFTPAQEARLAEQRKEFLENLFRALEAPSRAKAARRKRRVPKAAARKK
jgi:DNA-binding PadR family transcriptional regulator